MASVGWLHLSDLHQGMDGQGWLWPNIRELFYDDLFKLHKVSGPWDVVFFTGDLTQRGSDTEFALLNKTLSDLWDHLRDLGSNPMLLTVPGNHDLVRPLASMPAVKVLNGWGSDPEVLKEFWSDPTSDYRLVVDKAFANYFSWSKKHSLPRPAKFSTGILPGDFAATLQKDGAKIGIVGLNSAFLQLTGANYEGKLDLSVAQLHAACGGDGAAWTKHHDLCLLLTHHPPDWLCGAGKQTLHGEIAPPGRFAVHLFGHMHEGKMQTLSFGGTAPWRYWQAASLFGLESWGTAHETRAHGYSAGRIKFDGDRAFLRIWPRIGTRRTDGVWRIVPNVQEFDLEDDYATRPEEIPLRKPIAPKVSPVPIADTLAPTGAAFRAHEPARVVISYASVDQAYARQLRVHLSLLIRRREIVLWDESQIAAGIEVVGERARKLSEANIVLVLLSADYLSEGFDEMTTLRERSDEGFVRLVPIVIRACDWKPSPMGKIQALPRNETPITSWENPDDAFVDVIAGLRNVIADVVRTTPFPPPSVKPVKLVPIGYIFRTTGQPDFTFVEPSQMLKLSGYLRIMGQGLVVEGPSGIGKTVATRTALNGVKGPFVVHYKTSKNKADVVDIDKALTSGFKGHLVVDDFHHLDDAHKAGLAALIKTLADQDSRDAKLTIVGINPVGDSLVAGFPDLAGRFETVSMAIQPRDKLDELIRKGERAANVSFRARSEFVETAAGSFYTLQQLCLEAAMQQGILETQPTTEYIVTSPRDVVEAVLDKLKFKYYQPLSTFAATDAVVPPRGAVLALLYLMSDNDAGHISIHDAKLRYPTLKHAFEWLANGNLAASFQVIPQLEKLFFYQQSAGVLSAEDPQLKFYLRNLKWVDFAKKTGHQGVRLNPRYGLTFGE